MINRLAEKLVVCRNFSLNIFLIWLAVITKLIAVRHYYIPFANCLRSLSVQLFLEKFDDELKTKLSTIAGNVITGASSLHVDVGSGHLGHNDIMIYT